jgi:hypothetical protein
MKWFSTYFSFAGSKAGYDKGVRHPKVNMGVSTIELRSASLRSVSMTL